MKIENMKIGNTYIIKGKNAHNNRTVHKITVKEITQETLLLYYEDSRNTIRTLKSEFDYQWKVIEYIPVDLHLSSYDNDYNNIRFNNEEKIKKCFCGGPFDIVARDNRTFYECPNGHITF
ncbi:MAG: hypothetical protein QXL18_05060 [Candidatus Woesearchaeota archaeon]